MTVQLGPTTIELDWTGVETSYAPGLQAMAVADVTVQHVQANGAATLLINGINYIATLDAASRFYSIVPIGSLGLAPAKIRFSRTTLDVVNANFTGGAYSNKTHQDVADAAAMRDAELRAIGARAVLVPIGEMPVTLPASASRANKNAGYDSEGKPTVTTLVPNAVYSGPGAPLAGFGALGDFYVDTVAPRFYGPKTAGGWGAGVAMQTALDIPNLPAGTAADDLDLVAVHDAQAAQTRKLTKKQFAAAEVLADATDLDALTGRGAYVVTSPTSAPDGTAGLIYLIETAEGGSAPARLQFATLLSGGAAARRWLRRRSGVSPWGAWDEIARISASPQFPALAAQNYLRVDAAGTALEWRTPANVLVDVGAAPRRNVLINGGFTIYARPAGATSDAAYGPDRWYVLTETGSVTLAAIANPEDGAISAAQVTQPDVTAKRIGLAQAVESVNCTHTRGGPVVFSGRVRLSVAGTIRYAILAHTGTADAITRDVVAAWGNASFTPGQFFIAGVSVVALGAQVVSANTWTDLAAASGAVPSATNNLIVLAWSDAALAQNVTLQLAKMKLEQGAAKTSFEYDDVIKERLSCERYYEAHQQAYVWGGYATAGPTFTAWGSMPWRVVKRTTPILSWSVISQNTFIAQVTVHGLFIQSNVEYAVSITNPVATAEL